MLALLLAAFAQPTPPTSIPAAADLRPVDPTWADTIDRVLDAVVILHMDRTRPFDGNRQSSSQATGFVVDAARGILLTNRHVVTTGPTVAQAIFHDKEEVDLVPLYVDPVHDFGFFRYDPADLEFITPPTLHLAPEAATVGREIRVIGNDAAEQISILSGTLSRLDRDAPGWDFNTFYLQAASSTSGGSSGSPVFDVRGRVVALNAGARTDAATSLFLPLHRVQRALEALQQGMVPSRGTVQTVFAYRTWDELRRLGLPESDERAARARWSGTGLLTVARVNPGGPGVGALREGDILVGVGGQPIHEFVALEAALDGAVGTALDFEVLRGGRPVQVSAPVQDLHALTPSSFLELGEGVLHDLGYHTAVRVPRPVSGVAVARSGRLLAAAGIGSDAVIEGIGEGEVRTLAEAEAAFAAVPDGSSVQVRWSPEGNPREKRVAHVLMNRSFWPVHRCTRDQDGAWPCAPSPEPPAAAEPAPVPVRLADVPKRRLRAAGQALVTVTFGPMLNIDSAHGDQRRSPGLLLDPDTGLVLTDRNAIPTTTGAARVRVGDAPSVPAQIVYVDPIDNLALVRVDPGSLALPPMARPQLAARPIAEGDELTAVALDREGRVYHTPVTVERRVPAVYPAPAVPRFQVRDVDFLKTGDIERPTLGGVLVDKRGRVVALLQRVAHDRNDRYQTGLWSVEVGPALDAIARWERGDTAVRDLGVELRTRPLVEAREAGLPDAVAARLGEHARERPQVLEVARISGDAPARGVLAVGDVVVAAWDEPVSTFAELRAAVRDRPGAVPLQVVRNGVEQTVDVRPMELPVRGTERALLWAGAVVQEAHPAVALYSQTPSAGVYLSWYYGGSPAQRYNTGYGRRIVEVDGQPIADLDSFLAAVRGRPDRSPVRLRLQGLRGEEWVSTLKLDLAYWPTQEFVREDGVWTRRVLEDGT